MKRYLMAILAIIISLPLYVSANNFPHIRTHGYDYWYFRKDLDQAKWLAKRHDWFIGGEINEAVYGAMKSVNPNIKVMPYFPPAGEKFIGFVQNWCRKNGYNYEDTFYHYYYDTVVKLRGTNPSSILIKGYGGGTASTIQEARVPESYVSYSNGGLDPVTSRVSRWQICPTSNIWRLANQAYLLNSVMPINGSANKYADGVFWDSFGSALWGGLQIERTVEIRNLHRVTIDEAKEQVRNDFIASMQQFKTYLTGKIGKTIIIVPNCGDADYFYYWEKALFADRIRDYAHCAIESLIRAASGTRRITRLKEVYDSMVNSGIIFFARNETTLKDTSEKNKQFLIASHYLINHVNYNIMYHRGSASFYGGSPAGQLYTTHWHKNLEYDIGTPVKRSSLDYWGAVNTDRFFVFASVTTNSDSLKNYTVVGREYTNALVLAKFGEGRLANIGLNPTTHTLDGRYRLLQSDNTLGPPITEIILGDSEGAILIKYQ